MKKLIGLAVVIVIALSGSAFAVDGAAIYKAKCVLCHGEGGKGTNIAPPHKDNQFIKSSTDEQIAEVIIKGRAGAQKKYKQFPTPMAPVKLTDEERKAVIAYLRTIAPK